MERAFSEQSGWIRGW
uniref:Uncharacterized protein n=1 Tax=Anguilla anguilla TaxID=7936 RepID=A0A0E9PX48_ANGAN